MALPAGEHLGQLRRQASNQVVEFAEHAKPAGPPHKDFTGEDMLLIANAAVVHITRAGAPHTWRRFPSACLRYSPASTEPSAIRRPQSARG